MSVLVGAGWNLTLHYHAALAAEIDAPESFTSGQWFGDEAFTVRCERQFLDDHRLTSEQVYDDDGSLVSLTVVGDDHLRRRLAKLQAIGPGIPATIATGEPRVTGRRCMVVVRARLDDGRDYDLQAKYVRLIEREARPDAWAAHELGRAPAPLFVAYREGEAVGYVMPIHRPGELI